MTEEILKLAKRYQDALIGEGDELIGFEFSCASIEAFYRAAYNKAIEDAAEAMCGEPICSGVSAAIIRSLDMKP